MSYLMKTFNGPTFDTVPHAAECINGVRALFDAVGLIQTADTGQLGDPYLIPGLTLSTMIGYEVRTWDDGVSPLYMRWEYWVGTAAGSSYFKVNVGTGTDGAGNITGLLFGPLNTSGNVSTYSPLFENFISRSGTALTIAIQGALNYYHFLHIDRQRNQSTGAPIPDSYCFAYSTTNQGSSVKYITPSLGWNVTVDMGGSNVKNPSHPLGPTLTSGTAMGLEQAKYDLVPLFGYYKEGLFIQPGIMTYSVYDIIPSARQEFDVVLFGQTRHYKAISTKLFASNSTASWGWAMLWE